MRIFTISELWGPMACEEKGCRECECDSILLTDEENDQLPEKTGPAAVRYIFKNSLGDALCDKHLKERLKFIEEYKVDG
jgi:hypothetical protein